MIAEDYIDLLDPFEIQDEAGIKCKYCDADGLQWQQGRGVHNRKIWVLKAEDGTLHDCRSVVSADDFPVVL